MKVTIGERLGILPRPRARGTTPPSTEDISEDAVPVWVRPEKVVRLAHCPSAKTMPVETVAYIHDDSRGPPRVRGEMVWLHKTAPILVIEGQRLSPEEHVAGRRR